MRNLKTRRAAAVLAAAALMAVVYATVGDAATQDAAPASSSAPEISGTPQEGQTLTATSGSWTGTTPMTFAYQWRRCDSSGSACADIAGATGQTYGVQAADVSKTLRAQVTASNSAGSGQATSGQTGVVTAAPAASAPANTDRPAISGMLAQGRTLAVSNGTWTGTQPIAYSYEWQRCNAQGASCATISGATSATYTLVSADVGARIQALVTAKNSAGSNHAYSNQTGQVSPSGGPVNTTAPLVTGTLVPGSTLSVTSGTWTGTGTIIYRYEWQRCTAQGSGCAAIPGATTTRYTLTPADAGRRVQVLVTATNSAGSTQKYSNQTGLVGAAGAVSVPASSVALPDRLVVDRVSYPGGGHSRTPFTARFHVSDTAGRSVSGAYVYTIGLAYGRIATVPEQPTDGQGWVNLTLRPTAKMPRTGYLVMFVRARTPQGDLLAGASTRRLVQVRVRP